MFYALLKWETVGCYISSHDPALNNKQTRPVVCVCVCVCVCVGTRVFMGMYRMRVCVWVYLCVEVDAWCVCVCSGYVCSLNSHYHVCTSIGLQAKYE